MENLPIYDDDILSVREEFEKRLNRDGVDLSRARVVLEKRSNRFATKYYHVRKFGVMSKDGSQISAVYRLQRNGTVSVSPVAFQSNVVIEGEYKCQK